MMGTFNVYVQRGISKKTLVFTKNSPQGSEWNKQSIQIPSSGTSFKVGHHTPRRCLFEYISLVDNTPPPGLFFSLLVLSFRNFNKENSQLPPESPKDPLSPPRVLCKHAAISNCLNINFAQSRNCAHGTTVKKAQIICQFDHCSIDQYFLFWPNFISLSLIL